MKATLEIKVWNNRNYSPSFKEIGAISIFPDSKKQLDGPFIYMDSFKARLSDSIEKKEGNCHIEINDGEKGLFSGSFDELAIALSRSNAACFFAEWIFDNTIPVDDNGVQRWRIVSDSAKEANDFNKMDSNQLFEWFFTNVWKANATKP